MFRFLESQILYLNAVRLPLFADYDHPEKYGLSAKQTLNLKIHTPDNETIGAWFILAGPYYDTLPSAPSSVSVDTHWHTKPALAKHPTVLFLHGNSATRAFHPRILHYRAFTAHLGANVLAIDYRGFADSTGTPSEPGLVCDARAAWDWLVAEGAKGEDILVVGHSLGTGVASQLGAQLSRQGVGCRGVVLLSPFSSVPEALSTYNMFGAIPLMKPLALIPPLPSMITQALVHKFDSLSAVPDIKFPLLIAHALDDWVIPHTHSDVLFNAILEPVLFNAILEPVLSNTILEPILSNTILEPVLSNAILEPSLPLPLRPPPPPRNALQLTPEETHAEEARRARRVQLVTHTDLPGVGTMDVFVPDHDQEDVHDQQGVRDREGVRDQQDVLDQQGVRDQQGVHGQEGRKVVLVKTLKGGHDYLGVQESVQDAIGRSFGFF